MNKCAKLTDKQLQAMLDKASKHLSIAMEALQTIDAHCEAVYGCAPSDVDADEILDAVYGSCGPPSSMPVAEFKDVMERLS